MRLYHFINAQYGLEDLRKQRLKIALIMELNDPFEFLGVDLSNSEFRQIMEGLKAYLSEIYGILCFSKSWDNPVQWSHYADGHKGLCLGFDIPDDLGLLTKVKYAGKRLSVDKLRADREGLYARLSRAMNDYIGQPKSQEEWKAREAEFLEERYPELLRKETNSDKKGLALMKKIMAIKFSHWRYEKEWRLFASLKKKDKDGLYYADFSDEMNIKEVIVGLRSCVTRTQIERELGEIAGSVDIFKARADTREFAVVRDENNAF